MALRMFIFHLAALLFCLSALSVSGQTNHTPVSAWLMPAVSYQLSPRFKVDEQFGYNHYYDGAKFSYTQAYYEINKYLTIGAGYLFYISSTATHDPYIEHDIVNTAIFTIPIHTLLIEDRNMYLNTFANNSNDFHYYRNRLRLFVPYRLFAIPEKLYGYDEVYYFFNAGRWERNRVAIGSNCDIQKWLNLDVTLIRQLDYYSGPINLIFVTLTIQLTHPPKAKGSNLNKRP
jgi:hypothetical protein